MEGTISARSSFTRNGLQSGIDNDVKQHQDSQPSITESQNHAIGGSNSHAQVTAKRQPAHSMGHSIRGTASTLLVEPGPPPDGGTRAWFQVIAGHLVNTLTWGYVTSYGVFQTYYVQELSYSASDISWIGSIQIFLLFGLFQGQLMRKRTFLKRRATGF